MKNQIENLFLISKKSKRLIIGLMSGTSLDGLDIALCEIGGCGRQTTVKVLQFVTQHYQPAFKKDIKAIFAKPRISFEQLCLLNEKIGLTHARLVTETLALWNIDPKQVDAIASHGQTVFHAPIHQHKKKGYPNATLQIGDGDHIAVKTGIITLSDFRQKHLAAGGEGAPLALYGDYLLFNKQNEDRILLNIGGIANFTWLSTNGQNNLSTDVGPGNTIIDQYVNANYPGLYFDKDAKLALTGKTNTALLDELLAHPFFKIGFPKTTGPELFNLAYLAKCQTVSQTLNATPPDVLHTLCHFTAKAIANAIKKLNLAPRACLFFSGGGLHNPLIVDSLKKYLPDMNFSTTANLGIPPDAKEAVLFAVLANETLSGQVLDFGNAGPSVCMGKISLPR